MAAYQRAMPKDLPIFISCSTEDIRIARSLREAISQLPRFYGYIARDHPQQFEYPSERIAAMLEQCPAYLIIYTNSAVQSPMTNQELGFFYSRWRREGGRCPILLVKSSQMSGEIEGFAYGREPIRLDPNFPDSMTGQVLWALHGMFNINALEVKCSNHVQPVGWPTIEAVEQAIADNGRLATSPCPICGNTIFLSPLTFLPIAPV